MCKTKNVRNYDLGKVTKFQDAELNGFWVILKKPQGCGIHPHRPNMVKGYFISNKNSIIIQFNWNNFFHKFVKFWL